MTPDDTLYAPIVPADKLRELVKRLLNNPVDIDLIDQVSDEIIDLFIRHGVSDEEEIVDAVYRTKRELDWQLFPTAEIRCRDHVVCMAS